MPKFVKIDMGGLTTVLAKIVEVLDGTELNIALQALDTSRTMVMRQLNEARTAAKKGEADGTV